jgi:hypothetical protein
VVINGHVVALARGHVIFAKVAIYAAALEKAGIEFIAKNGGGAGVRLRKAKH